MTTTKSSFTHLLCGLIPDPTMQQEALSAIPLVGSPQSQLEALLYATASFATQGDGRGVPNPSIAHGAALLALGQAASGLYALLSASSPEEAWVTLGAARIWTLTKGGELGDQLPDDLRVSFGDTRFDGPDAIAALRPAVEAIVGPVAAGRFAAWDVLGFLLHVGPTVDESEAVALIDTVLLGLSLPTSTQATNQG